MAWCITGTDRVSFTRADDDFFAVKATEITKPNFGRKIHSNKRHRFYFDKVVIAEIKEFAIHVRKFNYDPLFLNRYPCEKVLQTAEFK